MLACLGDLIEDLVVTLDGAVNLATDTSSTIVRRRGGSAANVAATAGLLDRPVRFLGQVGDDGIGTSLVAELTAVGVDTSFVRRGGSTGTIIVLVDAAGERSMLTDRKACVALDQPDRSWLDGVDTLHVPLYGLEGGHLAETARTLMTWASDAGIAVSIDASSVSLIESLGAAAVHRLLDELRPDVLLANSDEANALDLFSSARPGTTVIKRGAEPAVLRVGDAAPVEIPAETIESLADSTAAGDAFAAGFLTSNWRDDPAAACRSGHEAAAMVLRSR